MTSIIDFRSDFLSRPGPDMIAAMMKAAAGPGGFGLREDPIQARLEARTAELLGKEDALLFPTCTMANQAAILLSTSPGDVVLGDAHVHVATSEAGAPAALAGVGYRGLAGEFGMSSIDGWRAASLATADAQRSRVSLFVMENTHNRGCGNALPAEYADAVAAVAREAGAALHLDGSRLFNAAIALGEEPSRLARDADSVSLSLNKGLGAPIGALLAGGREFIAEALRVRQRLGGGIRPSSMVAAAGLVALNDWPSLAADHHTAALLREGLARFPAMRPIVPPHPTNIVILMLEDYWGGAEQFCSLLAGERVLGLPFGEHTVRFVTYRNIDCHTVAAALEVVGRVAHSYGKARQQ